MERKKRDQDRDEVTESLDVEELDLEDNDDEALDLDSEDSDDDEERTEKLDVKGRKKGDSRAKAPAKTAKPKQRARKQEPSQLESEEASEETPAATLDMDEAPEPSAAPVAPPKPRKTEKAPRAAEPPQPEPAITHLRTASESLSNNVERLASSLKEILDSYTRVLEELLRRQSRRASQSVRIAVTLSLGAVVLSGISLVFSQNVRQTVLTQIEAPRPTYRAAAPKPRPAPTFEDAIAKRPEPPAAEKSDLSEFTQKSTSEAVEKPEAKPERRSRKGRATRR